MEQGDSVLKEKVTTAPAQEKANYAPIKHTSKD